MSATFFVSRQRPYYQDGVQQVEIAQGGLDYAGADMLCIKYRKLGEGEEFVGLKPATEAAIKIARQWQADSGDSINIACGNTHGMFTELEGEPFSEEVAAKLLQAAEEFDSNLPKCGYCGEILGKDTFTINDCDDKFCSDNCASNYAEQEYRERERESRKCPESPDGGEHEFEADYEYDETGSTSNCIHCGELEPE